MHWALCAAADGRLGRAMSRSLDSRVILQLIAEVAAAAEAFEGRWTIGALARVDPGLADLLVEQLADYHEAQVIGTLVDLKEHARGAVRGYLKAARVCEAAGLEDDAYLLGVDSSTGLRVAIGDRRLSAQRVADLHGSRVIWLNPDEVAKLWSSIAGLRRIDAVKACFPGATVVDIRPHTREWETGPHSGNWPAVAEVMPPPLEEQEDEE